jgi:hypothetical protein
MPGSCSCRVAWHSALDAHASSSLYHTPGLLPGHVCKQQAEGQPQGVVDSQKYRHSPFYACQGEPSSSAGLRRGKLRSGRWLLEKSAKCQFNSHAFLVWTLGTFWDRDVGRISLVEALQRPPAVRLACLRCVAQRGGSLNSLQGRSLKSQLVTQRKTAIGPCATVLYPAIEHMWLRSHSLCSVLTSNRRSWFPCFSAIVSHHGLSQPAVPTRSSCSRPTCEGCQLQQANLSEPR